MSPTGWNPAGDKKGQAANFLNGALKSNLELVWNQQLGQAVPVGPPQLRPTAAAPPHHLKLIKKYSTSGVFGY